jgi:glutamine synthetase|uniref:glutamine synthetase n=1 Tax=viral metagenome TaxID=1070528 RepID=A0A6C0CHF6_9ZZZZ
MVNYCIEYIWIDANNNLRSKTKLIYNININFAMEVKDFPEWNFDGSSTNQATGDNSDVILKPKCMFKDPFRKSLESTICILLLCETYTSDNKPLPSNNRYLADKLFANHSHEKPWYGLEQEYFIINSLTKLPVGFNDSLSQGQYYCGVGGENIFERKLVEKHLEYCLYAGINISGINAEVAPGQWEFQVGPCEGIVAGDHLWIARYILNRLCEEEENISVNFEPKPLKGNWNGSGCHTNFSTKNMREGNGNKCGLDYINEAIDNLQKKHLEHMKVYGDGNEERMSGNFETADYNTFTHGISDRGASIRRGLQTVKNKKGYFEDRRPSSNCDPYLVTSKIFETIITSNNVNK